MSDPGFDYSLLSAFRTRLIEHQAQTLFLDQLLEVCKQRGWLKAGGNQRTDATHVLARVRSLSNRECVGETRRSALDDLAKRAPDWLLQQITPDWFERSSHRVSAIGQQSLESPPCCTTTPCPYACIPPSLRTQLICDERGKARFPVSNRLMRELEAPL